MKAKFIISFILALVFCSSSALAATIQVPGDQPSIQAAINVAFDGDKVLVSPGTYVENINFNGKNIFVGSLFLTTGDTSYISQTVIDGNQNGSVVTFESGESSRAVLTGFTITNGTGTLVDVSGSGTGSYQNCGGGIVCVNSSPSLMNLTITSNSAEYEGGGIYCINNSNPNIVDVKILSNSSLHGGGVGCRNNSNPSLMNVNISGNNSTPGYGGGIICTSSNPNIRNSIISGNNADQSGGGIYSSSSQPSLENVTISDNSARHGGGAFLNGDSSPYLKNVTIKGNTATERGGGLWIVYYSKPQLVNVIITGNTATQGGGIECINFAIPNLVNVTIAGNTATQGGGIYCQNDTHPTLVNTILWNNLPEQIYFPGDLDPSSITISYSDVQGGEAGIVTNSNGTIYWLAGNIDADPLFVGSGDYHLTASSPCIDLGTHGVGLLKTDFEGDPRIFDGDIDGIAIVDIGGDEYITPPANAGLDQIVFDEVTLDGSGSYNTYGTIVSFDWLLQHRDDPANDRTTAGVNPTISSLEPGFYDVTLTITDDVGLTGTDTMLLAVAGSCGCNAITMHIQSIIAGTAPDRKNLKYGRVTVTIFDDCGGPVSGASVTGAFTGDYDQTIAGSTGLDGTAVITTSSSAKKPSYTFCVDLDGVSHGTLAYEPNDNIEDCKSK